MNYDKVLKHMLLTCQFCGLTGSKNDGTFEFDNFNVGFWCSDCDGFSYLNENDSKHNFTLILETKGKSKDSILFKRPNIKLSKRLSPYRYPGGKTNIIEFLYQHLQENKSKILISPFTGGASFELAMLNAGVVDNIHLNDIDTGVYSFWWVVKHIPFELTYRLKNVLPSHNDFFYLQQKMKNNYQGMDIIESAWASLVVNRLSYSGISKANPLGGKNGSIENLLSRWNPDELINRIDKIHSMSDKIIITQENAVDLIEESYWLDKATIFIDPPYVNKGKYLYHCYYTKEDHIKLSFLLDSLYSGFPGADLIVTYDYNELLDNLYSYPDKKIIKRTYSA